MGRAPMTVFLNGSYLTENNFTIGMIVKSYVLIDNISDLDSSYIDGLLALSLLLKILFIYEPIANDRYWFILGRGKNRNTVFR